MPNHRINNAPNELGVYGNVWSQGGNSITIRGADIVDANPSVHPSKNMVEAHMKALRLYRKICRMIPFILRIHYLNTRVNPIQARMHVATLFREKSHIRSPQIADRLVTIGYEKLYEAEQHYTHFSYLYQYLSPANATPGDRGYSYLEEKRLGSRSKFLKEFYIGNRPAF